MRNTSDKPVYGLQAYLFFKSDGVPMLFSVELTGSKQLGHDPLLPGAEMQLLVNQGLLNQTLTEGKYRGADLSRAVVSFSLDMVIFAEDLRWYRGKLVRPDAVHQANGLLSMNLWPSNATTRR